MARRQDEALPESDRFLDFGLPRENHHFLGHEQAENELLETFRAGHLPHAFLIGGPKGIGKATLAWRFARFLLLHTGPASADPRTAKNLFVPPEHPLFRQVACLAHGDIFLLRREWNDKAKAFFTNIRIEDVRHAAHMFEKSSSAGGYRICIVDNAEDLNVSSANALLKLIEEPPARAIFLIISNKLGQILPTIRSRCRKLTLQPLQDEVVGQIIRLPEVGADAPEANLKQALFKTNGSVQNVLALLDGEALHFDSALQLILNNLPHLDYAGIHRLGDQIAGRDNEAKYVLMLAGVFDWLSFKLHSNEQAPLWQLAPFAEVWEKLGKDARDAEIYNLDKRPLVLALFQDLAAAAQMSQTRL